MMIGQASAPEYPTCPRNPAKPVGVKTATFNQAWATNMTPSDSRSMRRA
jgi:hypothetical protein